MINETFRKYLEEETELHTNMIFDVVVPFEFYLSDSETIKLIQEKVWEKFGKNYFVVITIDKPAVRV